jgi:DNA-binding MarR family transcriptional regulator
MTGSVPGSLPGSVTGSVTDEVDRIIAAWHRERPDLDVAPLAVLSRIDRLAHHLDVARARAFATHELARWEFDVLAALRRSGAPYQLTPGLLLAQTLVTSGTMTNRIDRLTHRGLVARTPDPVDRRSILVVLTPDGLALVDAALTTLLDFERAILGQVPTADVAALAAGLRALLAQFEATPQSQG